MGNQAVGKKRTRTLGHASPVERRSSKQKKGRGYLSTKKKKKEEEKEEKVLRKRVVLWGEGTKIQEAEREKGLTEGQIGSIPPSGLPTGTGVGTGRRGKKGLAGEGEKTPSHSHKARGL